MFDVEWSGLINSMTENEVFTTDLIFCMRYNQFEISYLNSMFFSISEERPTIFLQIQFFFHPV